jgi:predicted XRE-type DNA-binding protein
MANLKNYAKNVKKSKSAPEVKYEVGSGNVFRDLGFSEVEANKKLLKCQLMLEIEKTIKARGWTQAEAAKRLGAVQPRISEIMTTRTERFTIDMLLKYLNRLGKQVQLNILDSEVA